MANSTTSTRPWLTPRPPTGSRLTCSSAVVIFKLFGIWMIYKPWLAQTSLSVSTALLADCRPTSVPRTKTCGLSLQVSIHEHILQVLQWRKGGAPPHNLHWGQPRGLKPPLGATVRGMGRKEHLLSRLRRRCHLWRNTHCRPLRYLQRKPL